jgi:hypothetical protein
VDYYTDSNYDSLKPCVKITNHGERNMATCVVNLVWEDGEEGVTHEPVSLDVIKAFGPVETRENAAEMRKAQETDKDGKPLHPMIPDEEYAGTLKLTSENEWTGTLYTDGQYADNKVFRVDHMIYYLADAEGKMTSVAENQKNPVSIGTFTCHKGQETASYRYVATSETDVSDNAKFSEELDDIYVSTTITLTRVTGEKPYHVKMNWAQGGNNWADPPEEYKPQNVSGSNNTSRRL